MSDFDLGPTRALRPEERSDAAPSYVELAKQAFDTAQHGTNWSRTNANMSEAFDEVNDRIKKTVGKDVFNPFRPVGSVPAPYETDSFGLPDGKSLHPSVTMPKWKAAVRELAAQHPGALPWDVLEGEPERLARAKIKESQTALATAKDHFSAADPLYRASILIAGFAGSMANPADAVANLVGFAAGGAAKSLIKNFAINAATNAGVQGVISATQQAENKAAGLPYGFKAWAEEVRDAAVTGGLLDLGIRGPSRAILRRYGRDVAPGEMFSKNTPRGGFALDAIETPKLPERPPARPEITPELVEKARSGDLKATREIAERTGAIEDPAVKGAFDHLEMGGKVTDEAIAALEKMGVDRGEGMRMLARAIEGKLPEAPIEVRPASHPLMHEEARTILTEHAERFDRMMLEAKPKLDEIDPRMASYVNAAVESGLGRVVPAVRAALEANSPDALVRAVHDLADQVGMDRLAAEAVLHASRNPLEIAETMRRFPEAIDANVNLDSPPVALARGLARLSPEAFDAVMRGDVHPEIGALVAERVPAEAHARMVDDLAKAAPRTPDEAKALIDTLTPEARSAEPLDGNARVSDPAGADGKAQVERLKQQAGDAYKEAVAPIEEKQKLEARVETLKGDLSKVEREATRFADPDTGEPLQASDVESMIEMWRYVREVNQAPKPRSVIEFLRDRGGVNDGGGDIRHVIGRAKDRPGLVSAKGMDIDQATLLAWEAGYFADRERPTPSDLLEAIDRDHRGDRVYTVHDIDAVENLRVAREMERDLEQVGIAVFKSEDSIRSYFSRSGGEGADGRSTDTASTQQAKLRAQLHEAETRLAEIQRELNPTEDGDALYRMTMRAVAQRREGDVFRAIEDALRLADRILPEDTRVDVRPDEQMVRESGGARYQLDATSDQKTGHIELAMHALDPAAKLGHEAVHTLVTRGLISPEEVKTLAKLAREEGTFKNEDKYRKAYKDREGSERLIEEEAAASYIEARIKGEAKGLENTTLARVQQFIERLRNLLKGYGFQSREDVVNALLSGDMARREAKAEWGRGGEKMFALSDRGKHQILDILRDWLPFMKSLPDHAEAAAGQKFRGRDGRRYVVDMEPGLMLINDAKGNRVGKFEFTDYGNGRVSVVSASVEDAHARNGIALAAYTMLNRTFKKQGLTLVPDYYEGRYQQTADGMAFWTSRGWDFSRPPSEQMSRMLFALSDRDTGQSMRKSLDALGYYSHALEAAKALKQSKGTPEQMLAMLKAAGVKDAEIQATDLDKVLGDPSVRGHSITKDEIVRHLEENRVGLKEVVNTAGSDKAEFDRLRAELREQRRLPRDEQDPQRIADLESRLDDMRNADGEPGPKWSNYSLDPSNPTYRETVLHLPGETPESTRAAFEALKRDVESGRLSQAEGERRQQELEEKIARAETSFQSGHFPEPNIVGHMMTSLVKHEGKTTYLLDQIQSDWGQKLRDGGARDEAKIADLKRQLAAAEQVPGLWHASVANENMPIALRVERAKSQSGFGSREEAIAWASNHFPPKSGWLGRRKNAFAYDEVKQQNVAKNDDGLVARVYQVPNPDVARLRAEIYTAEAVPTGHPLVNTTDQWTTTTLRRAIRQAAEADAEYIAIPSGKTVLSYNPGDVHGMETFYDKIVPKNLRNILSKMDKASPAPERVAKLDTPSKGAAGEGFTVFPLTEKVKAAVLEQGQPLFSLGNREPEPMLKSDMAFVDRLGIMKELVDACHG